MIECDPMIERGVFDNLAAPFPLDEIEWRVGPTNAKNRKQDEPLRGQPLIYIDARSVMDRLDTVCGPAGWQDTYTAGVGGSIVCNIGIKSPSGEWIWKADGAGATDMEAEKGAMSDAFKRAAVRWGIGRYLYEIKAPWIELEQRGQTAIIPASARPKLDDLHEDYAAKAGWGLRAGIQAYKLMNAAIKSWVTSPHAAIQFAEDNKSMIAQLPVAMRKHLQSTLDKIGAPLREAAE